MSKTKQIKWFGMKLTPAQKAKIKGLAEKRGVSQKQAVMDLVDQAVNEKNKPLKGKPGSFYERNKDLCGVGSGPGDLSTNPKWMEGFGE